MLYAGEYAGGRVFRQRRCSRLAAGSSAPSTSSSRRAPCCCSCRYFSRLRWVVSVSVGPPVLCRQTRVGFGGRPIGCYRFRTTRTPGTDGPLTPLGEILVRSGIDKLPQLINVLKGEMSCVGPRPVGADELPQGSEVGPYLSARPGITGTGGSSTPPWRAATRPRRSTAPTCTTGRCRATSSSS